MAGCAHDHRPPPIDDARYRRALIVVLFVNAGMFAVEGTAGVLGNSVALQADALDFLGDAATYAISLAVLGLALKWRALAALLKGATIRHLGDRHGRVLRPDRRNPVRAADGRDRFGRAGRQLGERTHSVSFSIRRFEPPVGMAMYPKRRH